MKKIFIVIFLTKIYRTFSLLYFYGFFILYIGGHFSSFSFLFSFLKEVQELSSAMGCSGQFVVISLFSYLMNLLLIRLAKCSLLSRLVNRNKEKKKEKISGQLRPFMFSSHACGGNIKGVILFNFVLTMLFYSYSIVLTLLFL